MRVLIVGGTVFVGRWLVHAALDRGHDVTIFTRGRHNMDGCPQIEKLIGDRNTDVGALSGRSWDLVIDTCGYVPGGVAQVMGALDRERTGHYTFVSSVSAYADIPVSGIDESGPLAEINDDQVQEAEQMATGARPVGQTYGEWYGALKVRCERAAEAAMPGRVLVVRPGLIVGPYDYMDRFTYWVRRVAEGGRVLAPGRPDRRVRVIDARDLAGWMVRMAEAHVTGVFNASGAEDALTMSTLLETCRRVSGADAEFVWVDDRIVLERGIAPWSELPLWIPAEHNGIFEARNDKAIAAGLTFRPLADTARDTLEWDRTRPHDVPLRAGLSPERERALLASI